MNTPQLREQCAAKLRQAASRVPNIRAFIGLDGFVDEIIHAVNKRENAEDFERLPTISSFAERIAAASGKSTNIEFVNIRTKLGGNGPIMANAMATFGTKVTYLGSLGFPHMHPVFEPFASKASVHTIAESGHTDAVEFLDGKVMLVKSKPLNDVTWANIQERFGRDKFQQHFTSSELVAFVNWTMIPYMTELWEALHHDFCPALQEPRRKLFFDLADPEKRPADDIARALRLISAFERCFDVILGLNEKESYEIAEVLGIPHKDQSRDGLAEMSRQIYCKLQINTLVVHPVTYALAVHEGKVDVLDGAFVPNPVITTGAGDHFNSGFCLGKLLGLTNPECILTGVSTSGFYVMTGHSPTVEDLAKMLCNWPVK